MNETWMVSMGGAFFALLGFLWLRHAKSLEGDGSRYIQYLVGSVFLGLGLMLVLAAVVHWM